MNRKTSKKWKYTTKQLFGISLLLILSLIVLSWITNYIENHRTRDAPGPMQKDALPEISENIWEYHSIVSRYAKQYGIEEHTPVILAMMMQESGGRGLDPMQSSESLCGERNCIKDPDLSIQQGVSFFALALDKADGDIKLAVQAYNFGHGFIEYVQDNGGEYTQEAAITFSQKMYDQAGRNNSIYTCRREEAKELEACYGDIYYVSSVMDYRIVIERQIGN
ncbi:MULTISPECIES: lysozyme family protein [Oceanobacillus]|uniref:CwlT-like lysozyme domain-containing protein n=1 Tax=Oceanobacillus kimchii TaxID=746691 RepID=A0ABQ5TLQ6_9BACI|nr:MULTISPECIES: lysozyme family protein [Oceanobacillus]MBT2599526.1 lysozyme family protein [Oceanobacillus sp. ISL-74]GLO67749.1 hypothetical protein MACH08_35330 [Oceanobacillus kimchii]